jgi:hypothetical protein
MCASASPIPLAAPVTTATSMLLVTSTPPTTYVGIARASHNT